ncbi:MAG: hypothetical protein GEU28_07180 [Dehalococcoidia bacterium]|nr:hypothetical protein [Dehalococcoidia bacterium]
MAEHDGIEGITGYLLRRLGIRQGNRIVLLNAPTAYREAIEAAIPRRARLIEVSQAGPRAPIDVALIWPVTLGLFEQSLRDLRDRLASHPSIWVILQKAGAGLRDRTVSRDEAVASAISLNFEDGGFRGFAGNLYALRLEQRRSRPSAG